MLIIKKYALLSWGLVFLSTVPAQAGEMDWLKQAEGVLNQLNQGETRSTGQSAISALSQTDMVKGLKEALRVGTARVVNQLSKRNGFEKDRNIHIPLPAQLNKVRSALETIGMADSLNDLESKINRAAERATPKAKKIFVRSIRNMTLKDANAILRGPNDAATRYFERSMSPELRNAIAPLIKRALNQVGAVRSYDRVMANYRTIPMMPDIKANLNKHVMDKTLQGVFHYLAIEEAAIRKNPAKRTTEILRRVFGQ
ncbi:MAG: DUF4197 domain-containing protein [Mariprofundaceae bacterium]|nr:DUF4197 domain-containing protein [Mariprofundaceae bacterium]